MEHDEGLMLVKKRVCSDPHCTKQKHDFDGKRYIGITSDGSRFKLTLRPGQVRQVKTEGSQKVGVLEIGDMCLIPAMFWPEVLAYDPTKTIKECFEDYFKLTMLPHMLPPSLRNNDVENNTGLDEADGVIEDPSDAESHIGG